MTKPHLAVVHGMGTHTKEEFLKTVITPLDAAAAHFGFFKNGGYPGKFSEKVKIVFIDYHEILEEIRQKIAQSQIPNLAERFPGAPSLVARLNEFNGTAEDSFFNTHLLDVLLYRSYYADAIQLAVGKQLVAAMQEAKRVGADFHILAHSLGTAVVHDTLHKLYVNSLHDELGEPLLSAGLNKIRSITMVANVCQLPITESEPYTSVVRPGPHGICDYFTTCRHVLDPIASFEKFNPAPHWPSLTSSEFRNIVINKVERANVHDLDHYLADPKLYIPFFWQLFYPYFRTVQTELNNADTAHANSTVQGRFDKLKEELDDAEITLHWDPDAKEFVFSPDTKAVYKQLVAIFDHLKAIKAAIAAIP